MNLGSVYLTFEMHETGGLNAMQKIAQRICRIQLAIGTLFMVCFFIAIKLICYAGGAVIYSCRQYYEPRQNF